MEELRVDHPLRSADWIWPESYMYLANHFAQFRFDMKIEAVADNTSLYITADKSYHLYINGVYICRGPARGYQSHWPFDEIDITSYLRPGHNWLCVEAYQTGCSTFSYIHENYAGLLIAASESALHRALTEVKPAMRRSPGHLTQTDRYSVQMDFQEHIDLRLDDRQWIASDVPPSGWSASIFPPHGHNMASLPFGRTPYEKVEPRAIPMLREQMLVPQLPTASARSLSHGGYLTTRNVSWHWIGEAETIEEWSLDADLHAVRTESGLELTLPVTGIAGLYAVVIPPGEYVLGVIELSVSGAQGGEILDFHHDQYYRDGKPKFVPPGDGCNAAMGNRLILRAGENEHTFYHPLGFGAMTLVARDVTEPLKVVLRIRTVGYPFTFSGSFDSSDAALNEIYAACRRTQQLCSIDAYVDTPWREQAQWWGDARVQAKNTFYMDGDSRLLARGIRSLAGQSVDGLTPGHAPTSAFWCVLPDFALTWILTIWDYYWQTGDTTLIIEQRNRINKVLAYFDSPAARDSTGLLKYDRRFWLFEDWSTLPKEGKPAFLNLWYLLTLRHLQKMFDVVGDATEAEKYARLADEQAERIEQSYVNSDGFLSPALDDTGKPYGDPSVHDQALAIMLGISRQSHDRMMDEFLLPYLKGEQLAGAVPSAFWATYVLELAIERGEGEAAVSFIRDRWSVMMSTGTTWEGFTWREESGESSCHAWTSHPSYHLVNALAGIFQTSAGWRDVTIRPTFITGLDSASAVIPSPIGDIVSSWNRSDDRIEGVIKLPNGVSGRLILPGRNAEAISGDVSYVL